MLLVVIPTAVLLCKKVTVDCHDLELFRNIDFSCLKSWWQRLEEVVMLLYFTTVYHPRKFYS